MFRTVPLSIIGRFLLYTQQWYVSYRFADILLAPKDCPKLIFVLILVYFLSDHMT